MTIKAGDLVMVVHSCCDGADKYASVKRGVPCVVRQLSTEPVLCPICGWSDDHCLLAFFAPDKWAPRAWLIKIDPPAEDQSVERDEEVTA